MNLILQRQGSSEMRRTNPGWLLTPGDGNHCPPFHAEIIPCYRKGQPPLWMVNVRHEDQPHRLPASTALGYPTLAEARTELGTFLTQLLGETVTVDERTEMYCYPPNKGDVEFQRARYEEGTDTIRSVPENYCLISFNHPCTHAEAVALGFPTATAAREHADWLKVNGTPEYRAWLNTIPPKFDVDAATSQSADIAAGITPYCHWRTICRKAHDAYLQPVNEPGTPAGKRWLAWLISEYRKYGYNT